MELRGSAALCALLLLLFLAGCGDDEQASSASTTSAETTSVTEKPQPETIEVPDVIGQNVAKAKTAIRNADLDIAIGRSFADEPEGTVVSQSPGGGKEARTGSAVRLTVSKGPKPPGEPVGPLGTSSIGPVAIGASQDEVRASFGEPGSTEEVNLGGGGPAPQVTWSYDLGDGTVDLKFDTVSGELRQYVVTSPSLATRSGVAVGSDIAPIEQEYGDQLTPFPIGEGGVVLSEGKPGSAPALVFVVDETAITSISGGDLFQPAGE